MKIEIEDIDSCNKRIKLDIPHQDYKKKVNAQYARVGQQVSIPGFRKGKVPIAIIETRYGPEVKRDVLTQMISESITHAIAEKGIKAVTPPSLLDVKAEEGTDISVSATVEVLPDFVIKDYAGIELEMKVIKVTDKEVDEVIEQYRIRGAKKFPVSGRPVQDKDFIKIDFTGSVNGEAIPGGDSKDFALQVGAQGSLPAFNAGVIGMQVGETKDIPIDYAADYGNKTLAGKTVVYHVTVKEIEAQELPELNDEFAKIANPQKKYETLEEMKRLIREELADFERNHAKKAVRKSLAEKITELNPVTIPEGLVQEQIRFMVKEAKKKAGQQDEHVHDENCDHGHEHEPALSPEDESKHRHSAIKILLEEILISQLAEDLKIEVSEEDLNKEVASFMTLFGGAGNVEQIKREWQKNGSLDRLRARMQREKTLDTVLDKIKLKEEMIDRE